MEPLNTVFLRPRPQLSLKTDLRREPSSLDIIHSVIASEYCHICQNTAIFGIILPYLEEYYLEEYCLTWKLDILGCRPCLTILCQNLGPFCSFYFLKIVSILFIKQCLTTSWKSRIAYTILIFELINSERQFFWWSFFLCATQRFGQFVENQIVALWHQKVGSLGKDNNQLRNYLILSLKLLDFPENGPYCWLYYTLFVVSIPKFSAKRITQ